MPILQRETVLSDEKQPDATQQEILYIRQGDQKDGYAEVSVSADKMAVVANFYPPVPGGQFLTWQNISARLEDFHITNGILHDVIQSSIFKTNSTHQPVKGIIIAQGTPPVTEIPEHFVLRKDLLERKPEIDPETARIDWHSISAFTIVKTKEPIARRMNKTDGAAGMDVSGQETPFQIQRMPPFSAGKNVIDHPAGLFAGKSGRLSIDEKGTISIEEVLVLKKGVDFSTGNITFPGDIILSGKIADGFKIYSGGSLAASDVVDATEIVCKKDLIAQSGIEGGTKGAIRIGGNLNARYIQNCRVAVRGDVTVTGSIMQSRIYTMGSIIMGDSGKLVSSKCIVIGNIKAFNIGSPHGPSTYIRCGTDFTVQQELDIANEQLKHLTLKLKQAEEIYKIEPLPDIGQFIEEARAKKLEITSRIPTYLPRIDTNDNAFIEVRGTIFPGTEIEICHVPYKVVKAMKQVVFKLDKSRGVIITEPWKKQND